LKDKEDRRQWPRQNQVSLDYKFRDLPLDQPSQYCGNECALLLSYEVLTECRIRVLANLLTGFLSKVVVVFLCP